MRRSSGKSRVPRNPERRVTGQPAARFPVRDAESRGPAVLTPQTSHSSTCWLRTRGRSVRSSRLLRASRAPWLNRERPGAGQSQPTESHSRGDPLMCVLEAPASPRCVSLATGDAGLAAQTPGSSPFSLAAVLLTPLQDPGRRGGGTVTSPAGAVCRLKVWEERTRYRSGLALSSDPSCTLGAPQRGVSPRGPWPRSPGEAGGRQEVTKLLQ